MAVRSVPQFPLGVTDSSCFLPIPVRRFLKTVFYLFKVSSFVGKKYCHLRKEDAMIIFTCCQSNRTKYYTNEELGGKKWSKKLPPCKS